MDLDVGSWHVLVASVAVLLGLGGPVLGIVYAVRVEKRGFWRTPMMVGAVLAFGAILVAYVSGQRLVDGDPGILRSNPQMIPHLEYADRLVLPGAGYFVVAVLTGLLDPRTGALRTMLPLLLTGFSAVVLLLTVLSGDGGARLLLDRILERLQ